MTPHMPFDWSRKIAPESLPPALHDRAALLEKLTQRLDETQWQSTPRIEAAQFAQLQTLVRHFERTSPAFRARLASAGLAASDISSLKGLRALPVLTRRDLQEPQSVADEALPSGHAPSEAMRTSGSTGEPVEVRRTAVSAMMWQALTLRETFWHGALFDGRISIIRATNLDYDEKPDWGPPVNFLFKTGPAQLIPITADIAQQMEWLQRFQPNVLIVYPTVLEALTALCRREGITLDGLGLIWTVGEMLPDRVRKDAMETFGCKVADNYSTQEVGIVALRCPDGDLYHTMDETVLVETLREDGQPCGPGETGRLIVTDLQNAATPLIRYEIGDYAEAAGPCPCGRGLHTLKRIAGRARNLVVLPDGTRHWPLVGFAKFRDVAPVVQYQLVQDRRDSIEVRLVTERPLIEGEISALREIIQSALGYPFALRFTFVEGTIPRGDNGKFEEFVSAIQS